MGYYLFSSKHIYFCIVLCSFLLSQDPPELFEHNQSTLQSFYFFDAVTIDGNPIDSDDWVGAFNGDVCVGARQWDTSLCGGGLCDVPVMGDDGAIYTAGYMTSGDVPIFKIYDSSENIYYTASISGDYSGCDDASSCSWSNFGFNSLQELSASSDQDVIPELFEFNISTLSAYYLFYNAYDINGANLQPDDWVGAFKGDICVGAKKWDTTTCGGGVCDVPVMGDDGSNYSQGYMQTGEIPSFKIYDASEDAYYDAIVSEVFTWANFDLNMINYVQAVEYEQLSIPLHYENNLISFYTLPEDSSVPSVVADIEDGLIGIVGESFSAQNNNGVWEGSLIEFDTYSGYWLRMSSESDVLTVSGPPPDSDKIYELHTGLNLISFPVSGSVSIPDGIDDSIEDEIQFVIGESRATAQLEGEWVGSLTEFEGGRGYWINSNIDTDFQYDLASLTLSRQSSELISTQFPFHQSKSQSFYFMDLKGIDNVHPGDWIIAYNNDVIVGSRQWNGGVVDVPVMGYDYFDYTAGYCENDDIPTFKIYSMNTHQFINIESDYISGFLPNSIVHVKNIDSKADPSVAIPNTLSIASVYPNPFNPSTTINFSMPFDDKVAVAVYNLKGEMVSSLLDDHYKAGNHSITWDAKMEVSGLYFVKVITSNSEVAQKVLLIK